jgi:uncharacterized integral membrane protein
VTENANERQASILEREVPPAPVAKPAAERPGRLPRSRAGGRRLVPVAFALVLLLLLLTFILQNGQRSDVYFLGAHGHLPMGVALLLAAIFGVLLVALPTAIRIVQLRLMAAARGGRRTTAVAPTEADNPAGS